MFDILIKKDWLALEIHFFGTIRLCINFQQNVPPILLFPHILLFFFVGIIFFQDFLSYKTIVSNEGSSIVSDIFAWKIIEFLIRIPSRWFTMASIKNSNEKTWKFYAWVKKCHFGNFSERLICHFLTCIWILNFFWAKCIHLKW